MCVNSGQEGYIQTDSFGVGRDWRKGWAKGTFALFVVYKL